MRPEKMQPDWLPAEARVMRRTRETHSQNRVAIQEVYRSFAVAVIASIVVASRRQSLVVNEVTNLSLSLPRT